jgi:hypothetical protein
MSRAAAVTKTEREANYLGQIDANLREVRRILKGLAADRKGRPLVEPRKISILDEVKAILGRN